VAAGVAGLSPVLASPARPSTPASANPLTTGPWPIYTAQADGPYAAWEAATGARKALLAKIALQPRVNWITDGSNPVGMAALVRKRIAKFQQGNPNAFAQLAVFGLYPQGENNKSAPLTNAMQATYKQWINNVAAGIGNSKVIVILEPDLGVAWTGWHPYVRFALANYASQVFARLPHAITYLDASDADWLPADKAVGMLIHAGVRNVRGFALGATHYAAASSNISYGATLVRKLAAQGISGKHFVIDTADNGKPLTWLQFYAAHPGGIFDNANVCSSPTDVRCLTLGIPPTTDVANPRWGMSATVRAQAAAYTDAFLWYGRPWLFMQAAPFQIDRALAVASTTPWQ
jgi:endoglucanase